MFIYNKVAFSVQRNDSQSSGEKMLHSALSLPNTP